MDIPNFDWNYLLGDKPFWDKIGIKNERTDLFDWFFRFILGGLDGVRTHDIKSECRESKHLRDIATILRAKKNELDLDYIEDWVTRLGLTSIWKEMRDSIA